MVIRVPLGRYSQIQPACVLDGFPAPYGGARTRRRHILHVGCQGECGMTGASFETVKPRARRPRITSGCGVGCDRSKTSHNPSDVPFPTVERGSSTDPGGASPPGSAAAEAPSVPDDQVALPVPWDPTIIHILGAVTAYCTVPTIGWERCPTRLTRPSSGALRAQHDPVTGQFSLSRGRRTLVCGWPRVTPTTPFSYLGSPCTDL